MNVVLTINEPFLADKIESYIHESGHTIVGRLNSNQFIQNSLNQYEADILIASVNDPQVFTELNELRKKLIPIIFIENQESSVHYRIAKDFKISRYIVYPFPMLSLKSILDELEDNVHHLYSSNYIQGKYIFVRHNNIFVKIRIANIDYLFSEGNYTNIFIGEDKYVIKYSLSRLLDFANFDIMIRIHRNHAVQRLDIEKVDFASRILIAKGKTFPFGRTYTKQIRKVMKIPKV